MIATPDRRVAASPPRPFACAIVSLNMELEVLRSPVSFLQHTLGALPHERALREYESWWEAEGKHISDATDRAGTPWLRMFDRGGRRVNMRSQEIGRAHV